MKRRDRITERVPVVSEVVIGERYSLCSGQTARMKSVKGLCKARAMRHSGDPRQFSHQVAR